MNAAPQIARADAEEFTQALGQIAGGAWRQIALAKRLGVPQALGMSVEQWVNDRLGGYVRMAVEDRREAVAELKNGGMSNRQVAEVLGVGVGTVSRDSSPPPDPDGSPDDEPTGDEAEAGDPDGSQLAAARPVDTLAAIATTEQQREDVREVHNHRAQGSGENEWYTPVQYLERVRAFLGGIDLDPASSEVAQQRVKASRYFSLEDDGLEHEWTGRVWLNPPYAQPAIADFVRKLVGSVQAGKVSEAIMLTHNYTDTDWFQRAAAEANAMCFTRGRIAFESPSGERASPTQGQVFFYFGPEARVRAFSEAFSSIGLVVWPL